jgi:rubrerythrin
MRDGGEMEKYSVNEIIEQAVQAERLGYQFYSAMADRFKNNNGLRQLFKTLGDKELVHEKRFLRLKESHGLPEPEGEEVSQYLRAIIESEFFLGKHKSLPELKNINSVEAAVNFAMAFEKETLLYFFQMRDLIDEKGIIDAIISEEKSHLLWLNSFRKELLEKSKNFFGT